MDAGWGEGKHFLHLDVRGREIGEMTGAWSAGAGGRGGHQGGEGSAVDGEPPGRGDAAGRRVRCGPGKGGTLW
jgi:hypothetical protein